jgi:L-lactate dehydrogenase complex protein LldG
LADFAWGDLSLRDQCAPDEQAAIACARTAVAETGSLVFETGPGSPMLPNFLTLHQLVVVEEGTIVAYLEDIPRDLAAVRAHYWVTGVSGTTDIEGEYVRGAHGPRFLHVLLIA